MKNFVERILAKLGFGSVAPAVNPSDINEGDMILMEYARGLVETVVVEAVVDGIVYGLGDDGEPFCAPLANCDKVPY
jgi:predicted transcriptional regulator